MKVGDLVEINGKCADGTMWGLRGVVLSFTTRPSWHPRGAVRHINWARILIEGDILLIEARHLTVVESPGAPLSASPGQVRGPLP